MAARLEIPNRVARGLWLQANGLAGAPTGPLDVMGLIRRLGFVQIDTVRNVTRAHHHILWSRNRNYREDMLWPLLRERHLFEHFTHDASLLPMEMLPLWQRQFRRLGEKAARSAWHRSGLDRAALAAIRDRIAQEGPLSTRAFETRAQGREMWARPPHKKALETMWYAGDLATSHRENLVKFYDLGERVFPADLLKGPADAAAVDALCDAALDRLGVATTGEVQRFWEAMSAAEARDWAERARPIPLRVEGADGIWREAWGARDIEARIAALAGPGAGMRLLNPFDPAIRDRARLERLFGFAYRNEMFVPPERRQWGYYVYPLLDRGRFVGRVELKADRAQGWLRVTGFWREPGVRWSAARHDRLEAELGRFARLAGIACVDWALPEGRGA